MENKDTFTGFTPKTIQFLKDLEENNYKEWFEANRSVYEKELLQPFRSLILALTPVMYNIDPKFEFRPHKVMSRIYRDTRFSKNKDPYKTRLWITFQQPVENWENFPGYYLELGADGYNYGMGLFMAKKKIMDDFRDRLEYDAEEFKKNTQKNVLDRGFSISGEEYKRPLPNDLSEYFQPWYQKKSVHVVKNCPIGNEVFTPEFAEILTNDFKALEWLYNFMKED